MNTLQSCNNEFRTPQYKLAHIVLHKMIDEMGKPWLCNFNMVQMLAMFIYGAIELPKEFKRDATTIRELSGIPDTCEKRISYNEFLSVVMPNFGDHSEVEYGKRS